jgi:hypothetical protein
MNRQILNGWKQISHHLERGVRTAQRWESQLGMPVHRPALKDRSAVVAFSDELEFWLSRTSPEEYVVIHSSGKTGESLLPVPSELGALARDNRELICQMRLMQEQLRRSRKFRDNRIASKSHARATTVRSRGFVLTLRRRKRSWPLRSRLFAGSSEWLSNAGGLQASAFRR